MCTGVARESRGSREIIVCVHVNKRVSVCVRVCLIRPLGANKPILS